MAIVNPGAMPTTVSFIIRDTNSSVVATATKTLGPFSQSPFPLREIAPQIVEMAGTVYIQGSTGSLSALGFRFNVGGAFATIPIMNWSGLIP